MIIQFKAKDFLSKFKVVAGAASSKSTRPILENIKVVADKTSGVLLSATDIEHGICCRAEATVMGMGQALVPAKEFKKLLETAKNETVTLDSIKTEMAKGKTKRTTYKPVLQWGNHRFDFEPTDPDDYPNIAEFTEESYYTIEPDELVTLLERTIFAASDGKVISTGSNLTGVWLEDAGNKITAVATNGRHLAVQEGQGVCVGNYQLSWMSKGDEPRPLYPIIPTSSLKTLLRALREKSINYPKHLKMAFIASKKEDPAKTHFLLDAGDVRFCSKLVEARSAPWQHIVAGAGGKSCATVESGQLLAAIKTTGIVASTAYSGMQMSFDRNKLTVSGQKKDGKFAELSVPMTYSGKKVKIELNRENFTAMLQAMKGNICMYAPAKPGGVLKVDVNDGKFTYIIMTIK